MARTYRDIRRAAYRRFVERWFPDDGVDRYHAQYPRDLLVQQDGLEHICSPYCLIHWAKRVDRRKTRLSGKRWLQEGRWRNDIRE